MDLDRMYGTAPDDVWLAGNGQVLHFDGRAWSKTALPNERLWDVYSPSRGDVWAVGDSRVLHLTPAGWVYALTAPKPWLRAIHGSGPSDIWAVGSEGQAFHFDGTLWTKVPTGLAYDLYDVFSLGPGDAWAVGYDSANPPATAVDALHWDGTAWTAFTTPAGGLVSVWASGSHDVWATGGYTTVHWDGVSWRSEALNVDRPVKGLWVDAQRVWVAGDDGMLLRRKR